MRRMTYCASLLVMISSTFLWSQETVQPRKQRVSPKLLREAMALPEYRAQAPGGKPALHVDEVAQLADKLKKNGDSEGADLLQQFIVAHKELMKQHGLHSTATEESIELHFTSVEVKSSDIPEESVLRNSNPSENAAEKRATLNELIDAKKANPIVTPISITTKMNQRVHFTESSDLPLTPESSADLSKRTSPICGFVMDILPASSSTNNLCLQTVFEFRHKTAANTIQHLDSEIPGMTTQRIETALEIDFGNPIIFSSPTPTNGRLFFLAVTATRKN